MKRGEIWWAALPQPVGSGPWLQRPGLRRPVLVIQANAFNVSRISTVIVAVISSNVALAEAPGNVLLALVDSGLPKPSVVNVSQLLTVDRSMLEEHVRAVSARIIERVNAGLRLAIGL